eukprot:g4915.t1
MMINCGVVMTVQSFLETKQYEVILETFFENAEGKEFLMQNQALMAVYASGRNTALALNVGHFDSTTIAISNGDCLYASRHKGLGGAPHSKSIPIYRAHPCGTKCLKQDFVQAPPQYPVYIEKMLGEIPCSDSLFLKKGLGVGSVLAAALRGLNTSLVKDLAANVVVVGRTTLSKNFCRRLRNDLFKDPNTLPKHRYTVDRACIRSGPASSKDRPVHLKLIEASDRAISSWIGLSIVSSLTNTRYATRSQYDEDGPSRLARTCTGQFGPFGTKDSDASAKVSTVDLLARNRIALGTNVPMLSSMKRVSGLIVSFPFRGSKLFDSLLARFRCFLWCTKSIYGFCDHVKYQIAHALLGMRLGERSPPLNNGERIESLVCDRFDYIHGQHTYVARPFDAEHTSVEAIELVCPIAHTKNIEVSASNMRKVQNERFEREKEKSMVSAATGVKNAASPSTTSPKKDVNRASALHWPLEWIDFVGQGGLGDDEDVGRRGTSTLRLVPDTVRMGGLLASRSVAASRDANSTKCLARKTRAESVHFAVYDIGSSTIKFASDVSENVRVELLLEGIPKYTFAPVGQQDHDRLCGNFAMCNIRQGRMRAKHPVRRGNIVDLRHLGYVMHHICSHNFRCDNSECHVMATSAPFSSDLDRERLVACLFENRLSGSVSLHVPGALAAFRDGITTGTVLSAGDGVTVAFAIRDGHVDLSPSAAICANFAGHDVTTWLMRRLSTRQRPLWTWGDFDYVRGVVQGVDHFDESTPRFISRGAEKSEAYILPDGTPLRPRLMLDAIFEPTDVMRDWFTSRGGAPIRGIADIVSSSIESFDSPSLRKTMYEHIVCEGGVTETEGAAAFDEALLGRLRKRSRFSRLSKVVSSKGKSERHLAACKGGKLFSEHLLSSLATSSSESDWGVITKAAYEEYGPTVVHRVGFCGTPAAVAGVK